MKRFKIFGGCVCFFCTTCLWNTTLAKQTSESDQIEQNARDIAELKKQMEHTTQHLKYEGYMRSGFGINGYKNSMTAFQAPSSPAKYRLGNEAETFLEMIFLTDTPKEVTQSDRVTFDTQVRLALSVPHSSTNTSETETSLRETFGVVGGLFTTQPKAKLWAGQRFYSRYDININDFFYRDMSGFGGGVEGIEVWDGRAQLSLAWLGGSVDRLRPSGSAYDRDSYHLNMNTLDLGLSNIECLDGELSLFASLSDFKGDVVTESDSDDITLTDSTGWAGSLIHQTSLSPKVTHTFAAQYGQGAASNFRSLMVVPTGMTINGDTTVDVDDWKRWRLVDSVLYDIADPLTLMTLLVYEEGDYGLAGDSATRWLSAGIRPIYHIDRYRSLALEFGADYTDNDQGVCGTLYKVTLAPQITPETSFLSRPALRAFVTYAWWTHGFEGQVGGSDYANSSDGLSFGLQLETWW